MARPGGRCLLESGPMDCSPQESILIKDFTQLRVSAVPAQDEYYSAGTANGDFYSR